VEIFQALRRMGLTETRRPVPAQSSLF
jgi:hypothetical protein